MAYKITDIDCPGDVGLVVTGKSLEELFSESILGLMNIVSDTETIDRDETIKIDLWDENIEDLYYAFLSEIVFLIDSRGLLFGNSLVQIHNNTETYSLTAELYGEKIDRSRHTLKADIKAVTYYRFRIGRVGNHWESEVIFDL